MSSRKRSSTLLFTLAFVLLAVVGAEAQTLTGQVTDASTGDPMIGATVTLKETGRKQLVHLDGKFIFHNVSAGHYHVSITSAAYKTFEKEIDITAGRNETMDISLEHATKEMDVVTVTSAAGSSERNVRALEKNSYQLTNILSAKNIQLLPDITVANVLQRVSGVTIERSGSGEARYPIIRGMEKRYINTLVNGIKIPSPDNKNRFVPLDLFPSELLERLEVSKSLTPSMEGDAIGGTINLVMKDAPQTKLFQVNFASGYNNIFGNETYQKFDKGSINKKSPAELHGNNYTAVPADFPVNHLNYTERKTPINTTFGLTFGNRFGRARQFGFIISGSYQNIFRGTTSNFFLPNSQPGLNNIPLFSDLQLRKYSVQSTRGGLNGKFDYHINDRNKISFSSTFVRLDDYQTRIIYDTVALNSLVTNSQRSTWQYQSIYNATLQGTHRVSPKTTIDWSLVYSIANNHIPDQSQFSHQYAIVSTSLTTDKLQSMSRLWSHNSDKDLSAYLNFTRHTKLLGKEFEFKTGGLLRDKKRDNVYTPYSLSPVLNETFTNINSATFVFSPASAGQATITGNNYTFTEIVGAGYVQGRWNLAKRFEALGGVRLENTIQQFENGLSIAADAKSGTVQYLEWLPSGQLKYALTPNQNLRLSYYRALARPGFAEMINDGVDGEFFKEVGDPQHLKHSLADNLDLRYEWYHSNADQVLLGVFYKNIKDPIEISAVKPQGVNSLYLVPVNIGNATNYGFEAVVTKFFGNFGVSANYTYTKSSITNDSLLISTRNSSGAIVSSRVSETRPLQGQSNHIGNFSFIYKNPKIGLDFQAALVYTGERISILSPYLGLNYWQSPTTQLDFSFEKRLVKKLTIYGKVNNVTNAPFELSVHQSYNNYLKSSGSRALALQSDPDNKIIIQKDYYATTFLLGLRFKL